MGISSSTPGGEHVIEGATLPPWAKAQDAGEEEATLPPMSRRATSDATRAQPAEENGEQRSAGRASENRYQVADEIARGGMGAVMRALDQDIEREVALKYLLNQADARQKSRKSAT